MKSVFSPNAFRLLCRRYFKHSLSGLWPECPDCGQEHETETEFFQRISFGNPEWRQMMENLDFLPNSPTLFNAGTQEGTLSACFVFNIDDSMESILMTARKSALVQKWGGGVGYGLSRLRPKNSKINTTHGRACGPVAVLKMLSSVATMITQAGKRDAAQMGVLSCDHDDIMEFIYCKDENPDALSNFNLSVAVTDDFMEKVERNDLGAVSIYHAMAESAWKTGDPGCLFIDTANRTNPTPDLGDYEATNPCGEQWLLNNEACNLGSINLGHFVQNNHIDYDRLREMTVLAIRYLDHVLDVNVFPIPDITDAVAKTRRIGLGVMGFADMLCLMGVEYDSEQAIDIAENVMAMIQHIADSTSQLLAEEKGGYGDTPYRNAARTTVAPTGSIALLADCSNGIEPYYALSWERKINPDISGDGEIITEKPYTLSVTDFRPKTAHEIRWGDHVKMQAAFQAHVDNSISKTINLPNDATVENIKNAYLTAWKTGCKGITVFREGSRDQQVLSITKTVKPTDIPPRRRLANTRQSVTHKFQVGDQEGYLTVGMFEDGSPGELFINASKQGSTVRGLVDGFAMLFSYALQYGVPLDVLVEKLQGVRFEPSGVTINPDLPIATSLIDYVVRWVYREFPSKEAKPLNGQSGMICRACGAPAYFEAGCLMCSNHCGWTRCG